MNRSLSSKTLARLLFSANSSPSSSPSISQFTQSYPEPSEETHGAEPTSSQPQDPEHTYPNSEAAAFQDSSIDDSIVFQRPTRPPTEQDREKARRRRQAEKKLRKDEEKIQERKQMLAEEKRREENEARKLKRQSEREGEKKEKK
ncbi:unnamed protein product [Periconia digitata]|uniref:Uncharacterized protein n=1 Tax=Periconia digitata TaxID=1303443 RepID=A0A9W4UHJ6_9PLEO|nr:unnamed protein product [Periconia digitata]